MIGLFLLSILFMSANISAALSALEPLPDFSNGYELDDPSFIALKSAMVNYSQESWCSKAKVQMLMDTVIIAKPKICVEIGVFAGSTALPIAAALKYLGDGVLIAIDPWSNAEAIRYLNPEDVNTEWWRSVDMDYAYQQFQASLGNWELHSYCEIFCESSSSAIAKIPEIDFLHVDGNYSEEGSLKDVELYLSKVKNGGYVFISNIFWIVNGFPPRRAALQHLLDYCVIVGAIEDNNCILLRKVREV